MRAAALVARSSIRRQWRSLAAIALMVGLAGALVLATVAGARRTSSTLERFSDFSRPADVEIVAGEVASPEQMRSFRHIADVAEVAELHQMNVVLPDGTFLPLAAAVDGRFGTVVDRARVIDGRLPKLSEPLELAIGETLAKRLHVGVGDIATFNSYDVAQTDVARATNGDPGPPVGPVLHFRVVGVVRRPLDLGVRGGPGGVVVPTPGFLARYGDEIGSFGGSILRVRTKHGTSDLPRVIDAARRIFGGPEFTVQGLGVETEGARDAIDILTIALWIFAGVATLAGVVSIGIVASRQIESEEDDQATLASLGLTRWQRAAAAGALLIPAAVIGAALAVVAAALASPLLPFGVARQAEIDPGFQLDGLVLAAGMLLIVAFVLLVAAFAGFRVARSTDSVRAQSALARPSAIARVAAGAGVGPTVTTGLRMALEPGRGRTAVPVRSAFVGAVLGTVGIVAVLLFSSSLSHLVATPRLYGWSFDALVLPREDGQPGTSGPCSRIQPNVARDPQIAAFAAVCQTGVEVDGRPASAQAISAIRGSIGPVVATGRAPRAADEVALGAATLDSLGKQVGDHVHIREKAQTERYLVVGQAVLPSPTTLDPQPVADGAVFTDRGLTRLFVPDEPHDTNIVVRLAPGVSTADLPKVPPDVERQLGAGKFRKLASGAAVLPSVPVELERLRQIDQLPTILGALLALLAAAAVGHAVVLAVRRRRRDLAVLRTLGFERGQIRTTVLLQANTHAALGLLVGIPVGLAVGQAVWRAIAEGLGVSPAFSLSVPALLVLVVGTILVTTAIGALAARSAIRMSPGAVLRTD